MGEQQKSEMSFKILSSTKKAQTITLVLNYYAEQYQLWYFLSDESVNVGANYTKKKQPIIIRQQTLSSKMIIDYT